MSNPRDGRHKEDRADWEDALAAELAETLSPFNRDLLSAFLRGENMTERAERLGRSPDADRKALRRLRDSLPNLAEAIRRRYDAMIAEERRRFDAEERRTIAATEPGAAAEPKGPSAAEVHDWMRAHPDTFPVEEYKRCARRWQAAERRGDTVAAEGAWISMGHHYTQICERMGDERQAARRRRREEE